MEQETRIARLNERLRQEVLAAKAKSDRWLLVHVSRKPDRTISLGVDSVFEGFQDSRELRGPRWRTLQSACEFSDVGFRLVVAGETTAYVVFQRLLNGDVPPGVVMHIDAVHRWAPNCARIAPTINSVGGFLNPELQENRGRGAKRPGRVTRHRLTAAGCRLCGRTSDLTLHHLIPRAAGGATEECNLLSVCRACHDGIHDGTVDVQDLVMQVFLERIRQVLASTEERGLGHSDAGEA
jgi:HNH endonuclease